MSEESTEKPAPSPEATTEHPKKGGLTKPAIALVLVVMTGFIAIGVGASFYKPGGQFGSPTGIAAALAADVACELRFPFDAADDKAMGQVLDAYIQQKEPSSPMLKEFAGKSPGLGETISKNYRGVNFNPLIIMGILRMESQYGVTSSLSKVYNPFGWTGKSFGSFKEAIEQHALYMRRHYIDDKHFTDLEHVMEEYAPHTENNTVEYIASIRQWKAEIIGLSNSSYNGAVGSGRCSDSLISGGKIGDGGICPFCIQKPITITATMNNNYATPKVIILHYLSTNGDGSLMTPNQAWQYFTNTTQDSDPNQNKYVQFVGARDGTMYQFLPETKQAAGAQGYNTALGGITISVENEGNFEDGNSAHKFTTAQVNANVQLVKYLMNKYGISKDNVISHQEADKRAGIPPGRRSDPGPAFMDAVLSKI